MREIVHLQAGQCGNQIGAKVSLQENLVIFVRVGMKTLSIEALSIFFWYTLFERFWLTKGCILRGKSVEWDCTKIF